MKCARCGVERLGVKCETCQYDQSVGQILFLEDAWDVNGGRDIARNNIRQSSNPDPEVNKTAAGTSSPNSTHRIGAYLLLIVAAIAVVGVALAAKSEKNTKSPAYIQRIEIATARPAEKETPIEEKAKPIALIDMPMNRKRFGTLDAFSYTQYEHTDLEGFIHADCCMILCGDDDDMFGYELNGEYSMLTGELYGSTEGAVCWLEIYDGDTLIYKTPEITDNNPSCHINIDVRGVKQLTIYPRANAIPDGTYIDHRFGWLIAENLMLRP